MNQNYQYAIVGAGIGALVCYFITRKFAGKTAMEDEYNKGWNQAHENIIEFLKQGKNFTTTQLAATIESYKNAA